MNLTDDPTVRQRIGRMLDLTKEIQAIHQGTWRMDDPAGRDRRSAMLTVLHRELDEERKAFGRAVYYERRRRVAG